jgi:hypothetical protein
MARCTEKHPGGGQCHLEAGHEGKHLLRRAAHRCHALGCTIEVPPRMLMCRRHWFLVPKALRDRVWATYRAGQERSKDPSREYLEAADAAIRAVAVKEKSRG